MSPAQDAQVVAFDAASVIARREDPPKEISQYLQEDLDKALDLAEALSQIQVEHPSVILVKRLSDLLLLSTDKVMPHERALVDEVLVRLCEHIETGLRKKLAIRIARMTDPPVQLLLKLAGDEIGVAQQILENNLEIRNSDLLDIIRRCTKDHRIAIAQRKRIDSTITDALMDWGEIEVMEALIRNGGAQFSFSTMERLAGRSRYVTKLQELLLQRHELPPAIAFSMFWWLPPHLRLKVFSRFNTSRRVLQEAIQDAVLSGEIDLHSYDPVQREALDFIQGRQLPPGHAAERIMSCLNNGRLDEFLVAFAECAAVSRQTLIKIMRDDGGEALAALCKAVSMSRDDLKRLYHLLSKARKSSENTAERQEELAAVFDTLSRDSAELIIRYWDKPRLKIGATTEWADADEESAQTPDKP